MLQLKRRKREKKENYQKQTTVIPREYSFRLFQDLEAGIKRLRIFHALFHFFLFKIAVISQIFVVRSGDRLFLFIEG